MNTRIGSLLIFFKALSDFRYLSLILMAVAGTFQILRGDIIPVNQGFGFDGGYYGPLALDFFQELPKIRPYFIFRTLPSFIVHSGLKLLHIPLTVDSVVRGFQILNLFMLLAAVYGWHLIGQELKLSRRGQWLGFLGLFVNFPMLKGYFYEPLVTDPAGFTLAMYGFYFYLRGYSKGLVIILILAAMTWQIVFFIGMVLFLFPRKNDILILPSSRRQRGLFAAAVTATVGSVASATFLVIHDPVFSLGLLCTLLYLFWGLIFCVQYYPVRKEPFPPHKIAILITFVVVIAILSIQRGFTRGMLASSLMRPFNFLVAHTVWYGPIVILMTILWSQICQNVARYGIAIFLIFTLGFILSSSAISRHLLAFYLFFVTFTVLALEKTQWPKFLGITLTILSILYSRAWLTMNIGPWTAQNEFTAQIYWMTHGKMMSDQFYAIQAIVILATIGLLWCPVRALKKAGMPAP